MTSKPQLSRLSTPFRTLVCAASISLATIGCRQPATYDSPPAVAEPEARSEPERVPSATEHDPESFMDANGNGVDDAIDISYETSADENHNGIPDEVEIDW